MSKDSSFLVDIISPQGIIFKGDAESVSLPTFQGTITILPHHTPLFTKLSEGEIEIRQQGKSLLYAISGGFLEVKENSAHVLSDHAIRAESIERAKAEETKRRAEEKLKQKLSTVEFTQADKDLKRSILELKVAERIRKKQRI